MNIIYPIEQLITLKDKAFALRFAQEAAPLIAVTDRIVYEITKEGLLLKGMSEPDLEEAVKTLRENYDDKLITHEPEIKYILEPELLEPIMTVSVTTPEEFMGSVCADLSERRGTIVAMADQDGKKIITADVPLVEMLGYSSALRTLTYGEGVFSITFKHYQPAPQGPGPGPRGASAAGVA